MNDYDVIGSGAGGGTLAHRLAPSGKRILLLERLSAQSQLEPAHA
jgi:choline dehydrogenase-like flavoprotein